ncbi:MAG: PaaI family thioesterase [Alphaproteobacteria bacterium]|nr:PaaI family thioesterase [Alphaproteobacteria bacterium]
MQMRDEELAEKLRARRQPCIATYGGWVEEIDQARGRAVMSFVMKPEFCHSVDIVQGGFITGMVDAAMSHALIARIGLGIAIPTLEIKVSFLEPGHPGRFLAVGEVVRLGGAVAFMEGTLHDEKERLVARASATARIIRQRKA